MAAACSSSPPERQPGNAPEGFTIEVVEEGLLGPTQVALGPNGELWVADLGGDENDELGRVLWLNGTLPVPQVVLDRLDKPTGLAVTADDVWVMERRALGRLGRSGDDFGDYQRLVEYLPFNGRSEGTLEIDLDGGILHTTTGSQRGADVMAGSGVLWSHDPAATTYDPTPVVTGFKNAYAFTRLDAESLLVTEVGDGQYDGNPPPDELVVVPTGGSGGAADAGWPRCIGDRMPVVEFGGSPEVCADTLGTSALFAPRSTPTSVALYDDAWLVALWVEGRIVSVPIGGGEPTTWYEHDGPGIQHLLVDGDDLLVTDHLGGRILRFTPS